MPTVASLRKLISMYNNHFKVTGVHRMRKAQLLACIGRQRYTLNELRDGTLELRPKDYPPQRRPVLKYKPPPKKRKR